MLTLTETASTVVKGIVERDPTVTDGGLRIATKPGDSDLQVSVVAEAQPGDALIETDGARVYVSDAASAVLDDKTLDAHLGENGSVTFALVPQL
ncbi:MAG: iron-sulfur cluster assembly accessory protein [Rhodoglobus sp.]